MKRVRIITKTAADVSMSNELWFDVNGDVTIEHGDFEGLGFNPKFLNKNLLVYKTTFYSETVYFEKKEELDLLYGSIEQSKGMIPWFLVDKEIEIVYDFESIEDMIDDM